MITKFGKRFLTNHLAGNISFTSKELAFGISDSKKISSITSTGSVVTFTTTDDHGLFVGNQISVFGVTPTQYNFSNAVINSVPSSNTFTVLNSTNLTYVSGGNISSDADTRLGFEFYRVPVDLSTIEISEVSGSFVYKAVFIATLPQDISGVISEIALYPSSRTSINNFDSKFITAFENNVLWENSSGSNPQIAFNDSTNTFKIGESAILVQAPASTAIEYKTSPAPIDLSGYSVNDSLSIAYKKADANLSKIRVKFYSSSTQYAYVDFTPTSGTGDKIQSVILSTLFSNITTPSPDLQNIIQIGVEVTATSGGTTSVYFDGIRINDEDTFDPSYGMISRSVLTGGNIITKTSGRQVDVEYKLQLGF